MRFITKTIHAYLDYAYTDRDIRHFREVNFEQADREHQGRSAFKVMVAYERWLQSAGADRQRELSVLRLTGLFDRPLSGDCLDALRAAPAIPDLTDTLVELEETDWNIALWRLTSIDLILILARAERLVWRATLSGPKPPAAPPKRSNGAKVSIRSSTSRWIT
jgi:hypothetical protein